MNSDFSADRKTTTPQKRVWITFTPPSQRSQIRDEQARFFARLIRDLEQVWRSPNRQFRTLPEYDRLIRGAYACGFVCRDIAPHERHYQPFVHEPSRLEAATFQEIRRFIHYLMRGERHADSGGDLGGGLIYEALQCGALPTIATRLNEELAWREE